MSTTTRFTCLDPDWGHLTIKISGHPPFPAQVILNGHRICCLPSAQGSMGLRRSRMWHSTCQASMYSKTWPRTRGASQWWIGSDCPAWRTSLGRGD